jgi:hypothetical protein
MMIDFQHKMAGHCESGSTSNLLSNAHLPISEPMVFGIGSGLFFAYIPFIKMMHAPLFAFRILPGLIFSRASHNLGVEIYRKSFKNKRQEAMDELDLNIAKGIPVGLQVGVYNLSYFPPEYRMHYNMHNCIVIGKENGNYYVSDTHMENIAKISYDDLLKVRFPRGLFAPHGKMYFPVNIPENLNFRKAIQKGIQKNSSQMLNDSIPLVGVNGIGYIGKRIKNWPDKYGEETANYYLGQLLLMLEEAGTGGAGFRFIYGAFLKEAGELLNNHKLYDLSKEMGETANLWRHFSSLGAKNCKARNNFDTSYDELSKVLIELSKREKNIFKQLKLVRV